MVECHVYYLITEHLSSVHPLSNTQCGFQSGKTIVSALLTITHDWFAKLEAGKKVCSVFFFGLKKAFDSVPHREVAEKLCKLHISPVVLHRCSSISHFIHDTKQVLPQVLSEMHHSCSNHLNWRTDATCWEMTVEVS